MKARPQLVLNDAERSRVNANDAIDFLSLDFPEREFIIRPWLHTQGSALIYAWRGTGKTQLSIGSAVAIATGTAFLKFDAPKSRRVLYIDGELPGQLFQTRIKEAMRRLPGNATLARDYLRVITPDMQEDGVMPDLSTADGQIAVEGLIGDAEVIFLDTIGTLFRTSAGENDEESWRDSQEWILRLRRNGVSTVLVHHASKNGTQRGTSKREDIVDVSMSLKWPENYDKREGCRFECHYEKARSMFGEDAAPFEALLQGEHWTTKDLDDVRLKNFLEMKERGSSLQQIAEATGIPKTTVHRLLNKAKGGSDDSQKRG